MDINVIYATSRWHRKAHDISLDIWKSWGWHFGIREHMLPGFKCVLSEFWNVKKLVGISRHSMCSQSHFTENQHFSASCVKNKKILLKNYFHENIFYTGHKNLSCAHRNRISRCIRQILVCMFLTCKNVYPGAYAPIY